MPTPAQPAPNWDRLFEFAVGQEGHFTTKQAAETALAAYTTAHVTTLHTGAPVGEHGLYEWNVYDPGLDAIVTRNGGAFAGPPLPVYAPADLLRRLPAP